jgi:hypothetical protein
MSIHRYTSRGRTRQPKNLALEHHEGTTLQPIPFAHFRESGSIEIVSSATLLSELLNSSTDGANGYDTQNQLYLHLCLSQSTAVSRDVTLYGYNRQFGTWGKMKQKIVSIRATGTGSAGSFMESYVDLTVSSEASTVTYLTVPVEGIDRVAFVSSAAGGLDLFVAGSTF